MRQGFLQYVNHIVEINMSGGGFVINDVFECIPSGYEKLNVCR